MDTDLSEIMVLFDGFAKVRNAMQEAFGHAINHSENCALSTEFNNEVADLQKANTALRYFMEQSSQHSNPIMVASQKEVVGLIGENIDADAALTWEILRKHPNGFNICWSEQLKEVVTHKTGVVHRAVHDEKLHSGPSPFSKMHPAGHNTTSGSHDTTPVKTPHTGALPFSMVHPIDNKTSVIQNATHVEESHTGPLPFSMSHPTRQIFSSDEHPRIIVSVTHNNTNGSIPFDPQNPLLFNKTSIPVNLTALVPSNRTGLTYQFAPHTHNFGSALPALNGTTPVVKVAESPSAISQSATIMALALIASLVTLVFLAYIRSLCKKFNVWPFKKMSRLLVDEEMVEVGEVVEVQRFYSSVL